MLAKPNRLTRKTDFERLFASGKPLGHELCTIRAVPNELDVWRVGIVCGKQVGGAVVRNRARRRLREAVRSLSSSLPGGWDILLVIRLPGASATVAEFVYALDDLLRRRNIVAEAREE